MRLRIWLPMSVKAAFVAGHVGARRAIPPALRGMVVPRKVETMSSVFASCGLYFE